MRILVTGGMGEVGRPTVEWLLSHGHEVRVLDLTVDKPIEGAECIQGSITDFDKLGPLMEGMDGVVHLAAYRHPALAPEHRLFEVNVGGTFNVFRAAADAGIKRVVCASSINAVGYNFGIRFPKGQLRYFPLDEDHPTYTTDPYSFSKQTIEQIGAYFWRRERIASLFLRFPAVYDLHAEGGGLLVSFVTECGHQTTEIMELSAPQRRRRIEGIITDFERRATAREWEAVFSFDFPDAFVMFGRSNFWTSVDVRDAAQAVEKSLLADLKGSHALYIIDEHNFRGMPSRELVKTWFPEITTWKAPTKGTESLISIEKARELIGFEPKYPYQASSKQ